MSRTLVQSVVPHPCSLAALILTLATSPPSLASSLTEIIAESLAQPAVIDTVEPVAAAPAPAASLDDTGTTAAAQPPQSFRPLGRDYPSDPVPPPSPGSTAERLARSVGDTLGRTADGIHAMLIPAERLQPIPPADPTMDCAGLYGEASRLASLSERHRPGFLDDPRNSVIGTVGLAVPAAYYLWGVTAYAGWYEEDHRSSARSRLNEIRRLLADRRCFLRD